MGTAGNICDDQLAYLPIYDPNGGFVTGGGWINSPVGSLASNPTATGKANFGFVAKYKKGTTLVDGNTEFQFQTGNLNFKSSSHNSMSLVISGAKATYKGTGTINGAGNYNFMVVATDGDINGGGGIDKFRIKIWDNTGTIYDHQMGALETDAPTTALAGGSIVIFEPAKGGSGKREIGASTSPSTDVPAINQFLSYPNPFQDVTKIRFELEKEQQFSLEVYDIKGALVWKIDAGTAKAGQVYEFNLNAKELNEGIYFVRIITETGVQTLRVIKKKHLI